ncbi:hypothetical protein BJV78DRAFT_280252 [Lactifluus subvellereus]|nr:hypothetical protein BJV78DRAFT_280252 [Lactifluus subvellereus]
MVLIRFARWVVALYISWRNRARNKKKGQTSPRVTIGALPDNVLLDIFDFYRGAAPHGQRPGPWVWNELVHVCQRWRYVMFASPLRLDLCLLCTSKTPVRETLDVWPPLPIEIHLLRPCDDSDVDNVTAILEHCDRVRGIWILNQTSPQLERLLTVMQEPFPALTILQLDLSTDETALALPDMFLGGFASRLQSFFLRDIPLSGFQRLSFFTSDPSRLSLVGIPHTGYISPEAMVTCLSSLTRLTDLGIEFESPASRSDRRGRRPPPLTRVILPALEELRFRGVSEYLEDLVARIDAPRLHSLRIFFFNQVIFGIQQLPYFICRTGMLRPYNRAEVIFGHPSVNIVLQLPELSYPYQQLTLGISCRAVDWQVWSMAQICNQISFLPSIVEQLDIQFSHLESTWQVDMEDTQWLELFRAFTAVRTLRIRRELQPLIMPSLQELAGERATEVLPALDSLYLEDYEPSGSDQQAINPFIAARQRSDHPVAVHRWEGPPSREFRLG